MPVAGQTPTEVHLNSITPATPAGDATVEFQAASPYPDPNNPTLEVRDTSAYVEPFTGDSGSGGAAGAVPAPGAGDAAAGKYLKASGGWTVPPTNTGARGSLWYTGSGAPGTISGQANGDWYLDTSTSNVWELISGTWVNEGNIKGSAGSTGARGSLWYTGSGAPGTISGQANGDWYLDTSAGNVWELISGTWVNEGNIKGPAGSSGSTPYTITAITWGSPIQAFGTSGSFNTNYPSNQTFSGFKHIVIRCMIQTQAGNFTEIMLAKDTTHCYALVMGNPNNPPTWYNSYYLVQYRNGTNAVQIGSNSPNTVCAAGWNYCELHIVVVGSSKNIIWAEVNGYLNYVAMASSPDTNIDVSTGNFSVYLYTGSYTGGLATNYVGTIDVETW